MNWRNLISVLNTLLQSVIDEERGLRKWAQIVRDPDLSKAFEAAAAQCKVLSNEIERNIRYRGGEPFENGAYSGFDWRGRARFEASEAKTLDRAVLVDCARGEDLVKGAYEDALKKDLPVDIRMFVARQRKVLQDHYSRIDSFAISQPNAPPQDNPLRLK